MAIEQVRRRSSALARSRRFPSSAAALEDASVALGLLSQAPARPSDRSSQSGTAHARSISADPVSGAVRTVGVHVTGRPALENRTDIPSAAAPRLAVPTTCSSSAACDERIAAAHLVAASPRAAPAGRQARRSSRVVTAQPVRHADGSSDADDPADSWAASGTVSSAACIVAQRSHPSSTPSRYVLGVPAHAARVGVPVGVHGSAPPGSLSIVLVRRTVNRWISRRSRSRSCLGEPPVAIADGGPVDPASRASRPRSCPRRADPPATAGPAHPG